MSHGITERDTTMFVSEAAWHGLGIVLQDAPKTSAEALEKSGLDWSVSKRPMFLDNDVEVPDAYAIVRDDVEGEDSVLGTVGNRYTILQNKEAFTFFDPLIENGFATYNTAGSIFGGKRIWILAKMEGDLAVGGSEDVVQKFVLLSSSHDGSGSVVCKITPVRVVCNNTLTAAIHDGGLAKNVGDEIKIRHTRSVSDNVKRASTILSTVHERYDRLQKLWEAMTRVEMPAEKTIEYFETVLPNKEGVADPYKTTRQRAEYFQLMSDVNLGGQLSTADGTLWGAYNAVTAHADHWRNVRKDATDDKHLNNVWFGQKYKVKDHAFQVALRFLEKSGISVDV